MTSGDPEPGALGFDPGRLARVRAAIDADIEAQRCDGAALRVGRGGRLALDERRGFADRAGGRRLGPGDVFVSMSIGKQFTNALVLSFVERGRLSLHAPVSEVLPEFAGRGKQRMTLFHLLTHTSGMPSAVPALPPDTLARIEKLTAYAAQAPLESLPGERVNYSILVAHSVLGAMVVRADGGRRSFREILDAEVFQPLGMRDTVLGSRPDLEERLCPVVARYKEPGLFVPEQLEELAPLILREGSEIPGGGYLTTPADVHRFAEMLRRGGELDGYRLLSPAMIELASRNHTGDLPNGLMDYTVGFRGWERWPAAIGLGFFVRGEAITPGPIGNLASPRSFGGWGAGSTAFWVDPERDLTFTFLSTGLMEDSHHIERVARLHDMVIAALVE